VEVGVSPAEYSTAAPHRFPAAAKVLTGLPFSLHARCMKALKRKSASIPNSRWLAYATAGAASAFISANSAEAEVHYSGPLNFLFDASPGHPVHKKFPLNDGSAYFGFANLRAPQPWTEYGMAGFLIKAPVDAGFAATSYGVYRWVSQLASGENISQHQFLRNKHQRGTYFNNKLGNLVKYYFNYGHWNRGDTGFVAFKFDAGTGIQYGWARVRIEGNPPRSGDFTLIDYAYADPGEPIRAGQTSSNDMVSEEGSLGWLAVGAVGILTWRKNRSRPPR
jgi:hypothetical protein